MSVELHEQMLDALNENHTLRASKYDGVHLENVDDDGNHLYHDLETDSFHITTGDD